MQSAANLAKSVPIPMLDTAQIHEDLMAVASVASSARAAISSSTESTAVREVTSFISAATATPENVAKTAGKKSVADAAAPRRPTLEELTAPLMSPERTPERAKTLGTSAAYATPTAATAPSTSASVATPQPAPPPQPIAQAAPPPPAPSTQPASPPASDEPPLAQWRARLAAIAPQQTVPAQPSDDGTPPVVSLTAEERAAFDGVASLSRQSTFSSIERTTANARRSIEHLAAAIPVPAILIHKLGSRARVLAAGACIVLVVAWMMISRIEAPQSLWAATSDNIKGKGGAAESPEGIARELEALRKEVGESHKEVLELKEEEKELKEELTAAKEELVEKRGQHREHDKKKGSDRRLQWLV